MADSQPEIQLFNESGTSIPFDEKDLSEISLLIQKLENCTFSLLEVVYVDEDEIVRINREHLDRDYITDIITFRYDENDDNDGIEGTLFCCAPRIKEQAKEFDESVEREFKRIYIHGLLHLVGYDDQNNSQKEQMTQKENKYLDLIESQWIHNLIQIFTPPE